ncbi:hypothetical protein M011DRAFT_462069 [Sporormia fimetaria CBS 119925]|uniref:Uncharacterized protein n=1 Tax=Sporormia fimetaria CBS 119925 TaxID=1340428 RepID=A0A6A6UYX8_9PLEO|nr:hypothetical protein M011DRAFT_462069 [Sporormia fimetaria CBS 119925]
MSIQFQQNTIVPHPSSSSAHLISSDGAVTCPVQVQSPENASKRPDCDVVTTQSMLTVNPKNSGIRYISRTERLDTPLQWLGMRKSKTIRVRRETCKDSTGKDFDREVTICETFIYSWSSRYWQRGAEWSSSRIIGNVFSTLQTWPVEYDLYHKSLDVMLHGSIDDLYGGYTAERCTRMLVISIIQPCWESLSLTAV